jgi:hypothetical protein
LAAGLAQPGKVLYSPDGISNPPNLRRAEPIIEKVDKDDRTFRSTAKWASLTTVHDQLI